MPDLLSIVRNILHVASENGFVEKIHLVDACKSNDISEDGYNLILLELDKRNIEILDNTSSKNNTLLENNNDLLLRDNVEIHEIILQNDGIKARRIAKELGLSKKEVNQYLYKNTSIYEIDENYFWKMK